MSPLSVLAFLCLGSIITTQAGLLPEVSVLHRTPEKRADPDWSITFYNSLNVDGECANTNDAITDSGAGNQDCTAIGDSSEEIEYRAFILNAGANDDCGFCFYGTADCSGKFYALIDYEGETHLWYPMWSFSCLNNVKSLLTVYSDNSDDIGKCTEIDQDGDAFYGYQVICNPDIACPNDGDD